MTAKVLIVDDEPDVAKYLATILKANGLTPIVASSAQAGLMLVDSPIEIMRVSASVVVPVALATAAITFFLVGSVVKAMRAREQTASQETPDLDPCAEALEAL